MANNIKSVRWRIDTLPFSYAYRIYVQSLEWSDQVAAGDALLIVDSQGNPIVDTKAYAANFLQNFPKQGWFNGISFTTLASGVVYINVGGGK